MKVVGVVDAAEELGVIPRRVRQLLASGVLPGYRVGREWAIEREALDRFKERRAPVGRPWEASSAWAVLAVADGRDSRVPPYDRSRARRRLKESGLQGLAARLAARAVMHPLYGHPSVLSRLSADSGIIRSGASAAIDHRADIVVSDFVEGYARSSKVPAIAQRYALEPNPERPNVILREVEDLIWPFGPDDHVAPRAVVALDLLEARDERSRRAGAELALRS